ncbi:MAG: type I DNA topoisomerase [Bacteroidales bacterium]|jgi:DNA topoisomerase-1|nr:type I DNA topoisomerase [Bacteroidales bacterium]
MEENLVIVESPAKAETIKRFLGKDFLVKSSFGHIRDLSKKNFGIDVEKDFKPNYEVSPDKKKITAELKKLAKQAKIVWLASDEDREGEAIAWHLAEELNLSKDATKRIVFHEITKTAIQNAVKNPREIDYNLVNAQQARRVLDRLVGFNLSPLLWKKIKPSLSAGRVQSVAVRLIVEREREINAYTPEFAYRIIAQFEKQSGEAFEAEFSVRPKNEGDAQSLLESFMNAKFQISDIQVKPGKKSPAPPFTTSTLQQEASRKLGFSVSRTMQVAQKLYEAGKITYMRTDSVNLSGLAINSAKKMIESDFGPEYAKTRQYKSKSKGAQEAHEAIRPTYMDKKSVDGTAQEQKLYELIWKRTVASQMANAEIEKTQVEIDCGNPKGNFVAYGEVIKFPGFLTLYIESTDHDELEPTKGMLPAVKVKEMLNYRNIEATQRFSNHPPRYTEASLVRKLEEQGIGRPSTYAPTISTVQQREYVQKGTDESLSRQIVAIKLENDKIKRQERKENYGSVKGKLVPTSLGMVVNDFLVEHFKVIMDYNFTAKVEKQFDEIAMGEMIWTDMIHEFYDPFIENLKSIEETKTARWERVLGEDPKTEKPVSVKIGRYGPYVQIGSTEDEEKPTFASLRKEQNVETITLDEAMELFKLPRNLGEYEDEDVIIGIGRFGPYVRHNKAFYSLSKTDDPYTIKKDRAVEIIVEGKEKAKKREIKRFDEDKDIVILNGRYGPYISYKKKNYRIPKSKVPEDLSYEECKEIIEKGAAKKKK